MSKPPSEPGAPADGAPADDERGGAVLLARAALGGPAPPPQAERESRERVLAQFRSGALAPRPLREDAGDAPPEDAPPAWAGPAWAGRVARALRRILGR